MDERDGVSWNAIISGYCHKGESEEARRLFDAMSKEGIEPGLVTWNMLIASHNQLRHCDVAMELMRRMKSYGITPDIVFHFPNKILTNITGTSGAAMMMGPNVIKSLTFHMTKKKHGPYGEEQGTPFTTKLKEGKIVGIHGRNGLFLDALEVHAMGAYIFVSNQGTPRGKEDYLLN
ncbi:unnamed protein product [Prunus armeniaca]|uniref:Jacalin-type lectin domain-containing protein n=1 Tax=Prunus armeniaca TaxID=36596 RepID=A0A6J5TR71_PRUAR|nr:unnamed protein product [Prunus armeniaca]CAB4296249.1 unnamed protein product [Prunus armeniaca]